MAFLDVSEYRLPVIVTCLALLLWYYLLLIHQAIVKHRLKNEYAADGRVVCNNDYLNYSQMLI